MDLTTLPQPARKSVTRRRRAAAEIKRKAAAYVNLTSPLQEGVADDTRRQARVLALLWVIAHAQRALALETGNRLGDLYATPGRVLGSPAETTRGANGIRQEATPPPCTTDTE